MSSAKFFETKKIIKIDTIGDVPLTIKTISINDVVETFIKSDRPDCEIKFNYTHISRSINYDKHKMIVDKIVSGKLKPIVVYYIGFKEVP